MFNETTDVLMKLALHFELRDDDSIRGRLREMGMDDSEQYVEQMRWLMENPDKYRMEAPKGQQIITALDVANTLAPALAIMDWHLLNVQPPVFMTSDKPVSLWRKPSEMDAFLSKGIRAQTQGTQ